jgi:hypothetical protein
MSARFAERERSAETAVKFFSVTRTVPGFAGTQLLTAFSGNAYVGAPLNIGGTTGGGYILSNATAGVSLSCTSLAGASDYNPDFVASVLAADAAKPEASFDNVVDLLDWLDRD